MGMGIAWQMLLRSCLKKIVKIPCCVFQLLLLLQKVPQDGQATILSVDAALSGLAGAVAPFIGTSLYPILGYEVRLQGCTQVVAVTSVLGPRGRQVQKMQRGESML